MTVSYTKRMNKEVSQTEERRTESLIFRVTPSEKLAFLAECKRRFMEQSELWRHMFNRFFIDRDKPL